MAHKKGQGSSRNGRDSNPQYRGVKLYGELTSASAAIGRSLRSSMASSASKPMDAVKNA